MFVCPECSAVNSADAWNGATREYYGDNMEEIIKGNKDFYYDKTARKPTTLVVGVCQ